MVDVLDIGGALIHAGPAIGAGPQDVIVDDTSHREHIEALVWVVIIQRALAQIHHDLFGAERLIGIPGRAQLLAAAALGACGRIQQHLPAARGDVFFQVRGGQGFERLVPRGIALEKDIEKCHEAVPHDTPLEIAGNKEDEKEPG